MGYEDLGFSQVDIDREKLKGFPEIVYGEYKSAEQIVSISESLIKNNQKVLITRLAKSKWEYLNQKISGGSYDEEGQIYTYGKCSPLKNGKMTVISAGTADYKVAKEAAITAEWMGAEVNLIQDVGVASLGRLLSRVDQLRAVDVLVVIAGMEGALPTVVSGLVDVPVIAVPTSVGYGANLGGITALLSMITSCSSGMSVVNIDNGFGAAYQATLILKLLNK